MSILTMSPSARITSASETSGEKWQMQLLTDTQVGKAIPLVIFLSFLKALPVSSVSLLSPSIQTSLTLALAVQADTSSFRTLLVISAAILYLVTTRSSEMVGGSSLSATIPISSEERPQ